MHNTQSIAIGFHASQFQSAARMASGMTSRARRLGSLTAG